MNVLGFEPRTFKLKAYSSTFELYILFIILTFFFRLELDLNQRHKQFQCFTLPLSYLNYTLVMFHHYEVICEVHISDLGVLMVSSLIIYYLNINKIFINKNK